MRIIYQTSGRMHPRTSRFPTDAAAGSWNKAIVSSVSLEGDVTPFALQSDGHRCQWLQVDKLPMSEGSGALLYLSRLERLFDVIHHGQKNRL